MFVRTYGVVGQVEPVFANIRDDASTAAVLHGAEVVVNCVGILSETAHQGFDAVQAEGAARIARLAAAAGVARMVHVSAIGADPDSDSDYARTKAAGEAAVLEHFPDAVILRPSVIFGPEDQFFNRFAGMARLTPVLPLVGAETRFQPVYVDDVAAAAVLAVEGRAAPGIYELGGPEVASFRTLMQRMLAVVGRRRLLMGLPFGLARLMAGVLGAVQAVTLGLFHNSVLTRDQVRQLARDNVVAAGARGFAELGIAPTAMEAVLESYLYVYRAKGQYSAIMDSARNLRG
jgi:NADH dehydrogenase